MQFLRDLRAVCDEYGIILGMDEVQSGMGRTGKWYAHQHWGVKPDVIYSWAQWGHIPSRRGPAGRLWIDYTSTVEQTCLKRIASSHKLPDDLKTQAAQRLERAAL